MKVDIYIEGQRLDLFDDETISVTSTLQDINDISKLYADFSQSFTVPASRNNNQIFKQFYNADINDGYDARTRKQSSIDVNTLDFKRGKMRLDEVKMKNGQPDSYRITFFGNAIKLKDDIGEDKLNDLTWLSNFDHAYSDTQVKTGLTSGLDFTVGAVTYSDAVIYPLISYQRQWMYSSDVTDTTSTDTLVNIAYDAGRTDGVDYGNLKPAIKLEVIIKAIEEEYGVTFTGGFFESQNFKQLYANLNKDTEPLNNGLVEVENITGTFPSIASRIRYTTTVTPQAGYTTTQYKIRLTHNGVVGYESSSWLVGTQTKYLVKSNDTYDYETKMEIITKDNFIADVTTGLYYGILTPASSEYSNSYTNVTISLNVIIANIIQDIGVYKFLESLFKMFNLVITPVGDDVYVNDLQTWYSEGEIYDVTKFVDTSSETIKRGKIYKEINFNFEESEQILADEFKKSNNAGYGDLEFKLTDSSGNELSDVDGDTLDIEVLFENPIYERLLDENDGSETSVQYCPYFDRDLKAISGGMFLFYTQGLTVSGNSIGFKNSSGYEELSGNVFMPSHSLIITDLTFNLNFNAEINEYTSQLFQDTIYNAYYKDYITDMFNIKRRLYSYKSRLPANLLNVLKLNDRLIIKDRRYIINKITSELTNGGDELELINDIYDAPLVSDTLNTSMFRESTGYYGSSAQTRNAYYVGVSAATIGLVDTGDGTSWITTPSLKTATNLYTIEFTLTANTGSARSAGIQVTDGLNNPIFTIAQDD